MYRQMLTGVVTVLLNLLSSELFKKFTDVIFKFAEDYVLETKSLVDDKMVLPILASMRNSMAIPTGTDVKTLFPSLIEMLFSLFDSNLLKEFADKILDFAEDYVLGTKSEIDDLLILPLCKLIRVTFDIPDNDLKPDV